MSNFTGPWVCVFKETRDGTIEYSVVRDDNDHGKRSYGWFNNDEKRVVGDRNGPSNLVHSPWLKQELRELTIKYARHLNAEEGRPDVDVLKSAAVPERRFFEMVTMDTEQFKAPKPADLDITMFTEMAIRELSLKGVDVHDTWLDALTASPEVEAVKRFVRDSRTVVDKVVDNINNATDESKPQ